MTTKYRSKEEVEKDLEELSFEDISQKGPKDFWTYEDMGFDEVGEKGVPLLSEQEIIEIANGEELGKYLRKINPYLKVKKEEYPELVDEEYIAGWVKGCFNHWDSIKDKTREDEIFDIDIGENVYKRFNNS
jgi:hypothetical protein